MKIKIPEKIIESFVYSNFDDVKRTATGELHFNSPFVDDRKKRLYVSPKKNGYFDQKQQTGGSFYQFVAEYLDISQKEVLPYLISNFSQRTDKDQNIIKIVMEETKSKDLIIPNGLFMFDELQKETRSSKLAKNYLTSRGINSKGLGYFYDPNGDFKETYHNRIFIPFYEEGSLVYFIARSFDGSKLRYKNPTGVDKESILFNYDGLIDQEEIFIFEGVIDALSLNEDLPATAMLTNVLTKKQVVKILDLAPKRVVLIPDNDQNPIAKKITEKNLINNINNLMLYKPPSLNLEIYIYRLDKKYKDFNNYYCETGNDIIKIEDCELYNPRKMKLNFSGWGNSKMVI